MALDTGKLNALNLKKRMPLIVAVIAGVSAVIMLNTYIRQKEASILGREKKDPMGQVLIAKDDIPESEVLQEEMILKESQGKR